MDLTKYRNKLVGSDEERAVSPVIGVVLMVAITVILAAVIAAFVMDMGDGMGDGDTPNAVLESDDPGTIEYVDDEEEYVTITFSHESGDSINPENLQLGGGGLADDIESEGAELDIESDHDGDAVSVGEQVDVVVDLEDVEMDGEDISAWSDEESDGDELSEVVIGDTTEISLVWSDGDGGSTIADHTISNDLEIVGYHNS